MWGARTGVQVSKREFYIHIHLDYARIEFYLVLKKKKKTNQTKSILIYIYHKFLPTLMVLNTNNLPYKKNLLLNQSNLI